MTFEDEGFFQGSVLERDVLLERQTWRTLLTCAHNSKELPLFSYLTGNYSARMLDSERRYFMTCYIFLE